MKKCFFFLLTWLALSASCSAQQITNEQMGGVYYAYQADTAVRETPAPLGFVPVYISHYGRHGSRWLPSDDRYRNVLAQFADTENLTTLGRDVRKRLLRIWADAEGRGGDLTALGARQQQALAERMFKRWPQVFSTNSRVEARSSVVGRCVTSMTAFLLRLQALSPTLRITAESNRRFMPWIAYASPEQVALERRVPRTIKVSPKRLMSFLFVHPEKVKEPMNLLSELHCIASDMQDVEIGVSLYDIFTPVEMRAVYEANNENMWTCNSHNAISAGIPERSSVSLWQNIVSEADAALEQKSPVATLRFGHDTSLYRLLTLLGVLGNEHRMDRIVPMAANLFMVFYRNAQGQVLVKFLHNEHEILLPMTSTTAPYYNWEQVKSHYDKVVNELMH